MSNIQISKNLFVALCSYFFDDNLELESYIESELSKKLDAVVNRELFTKYKSATTPEEREEYRKKYLDSRGILDSFRTDQEDQGL